MRAWIRHVIRYRIAILIISGFITLALMSRLASLTMVIELDKILPQSHPYVAASNKVESIFGNKFMFVIGLTAKDGEILEGRYLDKVRRITEKLSQSPYLVKKNLNSITGAKSKSILGDKEGMNVTALIEKNPSTPEEMEAIRQKIKANPFYYNLLISEDMRTTQITAEFKAHEVGIKGLQAIVEEAVHTEKDDSVIVDVAGLPVFLALIEKYSERMGFLFPIALLVIGLIHFEAFRSWQGLFLPLVTALLAVMWAMGGLAAIGASMDVFNAATPILILAIAAGHAVQILKRYYEEYAAVSESRPQLSPNDRNLIAVEESLTKVGPVMIAACLVAAAGFFSLAIFEIKSIQTFGIFTGFGVLSALVIELTFIPALRACLKAPGDREISREAQVSIWDRFVDWSYRLATQRRKNLASATLALLVIFGCGIALVKVDNSQKNVFAAGIPERKQDEHLNARMGGVNPMYILIEGQKMDDIKRPEVLQAVEKLQAALIQDPVVGKAVSIVDFIKQMNRAMNEDKIDFFKVPEDGNLISQYLLLYSSSGGPEDFDNYVDTQYQNALIQAFVKSDKSVDVNRVLGIIRQHIESEFPKDVKVSIGGVATNGVALNEVMIHDKVLNILQIMLAVLLVTSVVFRSLLAGLLVLVPLVAAVIVNFGVMGLTGITLQITTALVSAMAVGIGADYGIYMSYRLREELMSNKSETDAISTAFKSSGKAALFVSSAVAGGFGVMMLSINFNIHIWLGFLISIAMVVSSVAALTIFPALVFAIRPKYIFKGRV